MDIISIGIWFFAVGIGAFAGSFLCTLLITGYGVAQFEKRLKSMEMSEKSALGVQARQETEEEVQTLMLEATAVLKDENIPKEDKAKHLIAIAMKNPKAAGKLMKKFGIGNLLG